jgi:hypothetical protein
MCYHDLYDLAILINLQIIFIPYIAFRENSSEWGKFHPFLSLVVITNLWIILLSKILLLLNLVKHTYKIYKILRIQNMCLCFYGASVIVEY